jgi:hypothetical protein
VLCGEAAIWSSLVPAHKYVVIVAKQSVVVVGFNDLVVQMVSEHLPELLLHSTHHDVGVILDYLG